MVSLLIWLLIIGLVIFAAFYIINNLIPEPFQKIAKVIGVVLVVILLILFLSNIGGVSMPRIRVGSVASMSAHG